MKDQHHQGPQAQAHDWMWTIPNLLVYMETLTKLCCIDWSCHLDQWTMWTCMRGSRGGRRALGMVTNMRGRTSAARPVEAGMISLSVRVKWGIRFEAKYS